MRSWIVLFLACGLLGLQAPPGWSSSLSPDVSRFEIEVEGGPVWQSRNDVQIPNDDSGTRFSLVDAIGRGPWPALRLYATWNLSDRHGLRVLLAPLRIQETGMLDVPVDFAGGSFAANVPTESNYRFNSWRLSYRYRLARSESLAFWIGFTAKIRDARVALAQEAVAAEKTDVGFVPLLHLALQWCFAGPWSVDLDVDALAGGPGRAIDGSLKLRYRLDHRVSVAAGYRTLEGGADVDSVYNFSWLHYAVASLGVSF